MQRATIGPFRPIPQGRYDPFRQLGPRKTSLGPVRVVRVGLHDGGAVQEAPQPSR